LIVGGPSEHCAYQCESFRPITYLKVEHLTDGRTVKLMPLWDGKNWHMWLNTPAGFIEPKVVDTVEGDYVGLGAAREQDLYIPFIELMWQRANWPDVCPLISAISDDFHNMGTSLAKLRLFFDCQSRLPARGAASFASTELEYLVILARSVFDSLQEIIRTIWKRVRLHDATADERRRRASALRKSFGDMVIRDTQPQSAADIEARYALPPALAQQYEKVAQFFVELRSAREKVVHGGSDVGFIFETERGFCVNPRFPPFSSFKGWKPEHYYNENIVSILPWVGHIVLQTINACNCMMNVFASVIQLPPEIAPGYHIYVRGPHTDAVAEAVRIHNGASPWWVQEDKGA
jgi:hypothetical protein